MHQNSRNRIRPGPDPVSGQNFSGGIWGRKLFKILVYGLEDGERKRRPVWGVMVGGTWTRLSPAILVDPGDLLS
jgi:hypothetical protein